MKLGAVCLLLLCLLLSISSSRSVGRPNIDIDLTYIEYLRGLRFSFTEIARIMGISRATLYRRLDDAGIDRTSSYSNISDAELDREVERIKHIHPNDGERLMMGHLVSRGIIVQRTRLRGSIHRVDPENTAIRRSIAIRRRVYHVDGPNSVWHMDGHHKLIRWKFVTHGAIDGYSRTITFLKCADNNRASTVLSEFINAVHVHGLPERVRTDLGGENVEVWRYMVEQHSSRAAVITGSSIHNERIERLWREIYRSVVILFYDTFYSLERQDKLDSLNEIDLYCLHYVYLPRINFALQSFIEAWNNHPVSTEHNLTPNQLFIRGGLCQNMTPQLPHNYIGNPTNQHTLPLASSHVEVPRSSFTPCDSLLTQLTSSVTPLAESDDFGCTIYSQTVDIVGRHLQRGCNNCVV